MSEPVRLEKVDDTPLINKITRELEKAILRHPTLFLGLGLTLIMLLFIVIIFTLTGASATESGLQYNQFDRII